MAQEGAAELLFRGRREQKAAFPQYAKKITLGRGTPKNGRLIYFGACGA